MDFARAGIITKKGWLRSGAILCAVLFLTLFCWTGGQFVKADTVSGTVPAGSGPNAVAVNPVTNKIYVANQGSNNVTVIDGTNNSTTTVAVGSTPVAVAVNSVTNKIYVANADSNNITVIDGGNNSTITVAVGTYPTGVAVNSVTNKIYVANQDSNNVTVIDGGNNSTTTVAVGSAPRAVEVNSVTNKIYVANQLSNNVTVIDGGNNSTTNVAVGTFPITVAINSVTNKIYVANADSNNITVIDGTNNSVAATVTTGSIPIAVAVNPASNKIYVANFNSNNITVIDGTNNSVVATVAAGTTPVAVVVNPTTNKIYVANADSNNVTVIDGTTNSPQTLAAGSQPNAVAVNSETNKTYVANLEDNNVTVIDGTPTPTPTPTATPTATPTPTPGNVCTPTTTVTEGDLFAGGISTFGVTSGASSVTVDSINAGTGLQSFTIVGVPSNATVNIPVFPAGTYNPITATFTVVDPNQPVDFTLRAASTYHAVFIRARCLQTCTPTATVTEGDLFPGGISTFGVTSGTNSVTADSINAGTGLQSFTLVSATNAVVNIPAFTPGTYNPVVATYTITNPNMPVDFTLRVASTFHGIFIRVRCSSSVNTFSGRATAVNATQGGMNATLVDTGNLPSAGGIITAPPLMSANVLGGALTTGLLNANTQGAGDQSRSQATVETLNLTAGGNTITADIVASSSQCTCTTGGAACQGSIQIANLRINGGVISIVDQGVNQRVDLPGGGFLIYNEQLRTGTGNMAGITNNGLHVIITGVADDIISSAHSDISCATSP